MCGDETNKAIIVADGTYIYIQVNNPHFIFFKILLTFSVRNLETTIFKEKHTIFTKSDHY